MVLDKLGKGLRDALSKITGASIVDEKLINEIVKDFQRTLLQSDVNVELVFELTSNIKERAKEKAPAGLTKKEQLVNIVYEELTKFLGGESKGLVIDEKPFTIMLVGLFGNGKCVHKDSQVLLSTGESVRAEDLYERYSTHEERCEDGFVIELPEPLEVPSFNPHTLEMETRQASHLWKLKKSELTSVSLDGGNDCGVTTTPEHPFFVWDGERVVKRQARDLQPGDLVAAPRRVDTTQKSSPVLDCVRRLDGFARVSSQTAAKVKEGLLEEYGTLQEAADKLEVPNYASFTHQLARNRIPLSRLPDVPEARFRLRGAQKWVTIPAGMTDNLAEFIGYIIGDGYLSESAVHLSTADEEVVARFSELATELFGSNVCITPDKRSEAKHVRINSRTLTQALSEITSLSFGRKGRDLTVPTAVQTAPITARRRFVRAYMDCDAHMTPQRRCIEVTSESRPLLLQLRHVLLGFGIVAAQSKKTVGSREYYRLVIQSRYATKYAQEFGSIIPRKRRSLRDYQRIGEIQGDGKQDMLRISQLRTLRRQKGCSVGEVQERVSSYGLYEQKGRISRTQLRKVLAYYDGLVTGNVGRYMDYVTCPVFEEDPSLIDLTQPQINALGAHFRAKGWVAHDGGTVLTKRGTALFRTIGSDTGTYEQLERLADSDVCWLEVQSADRVENDGEFVYDLSVPGTHSFVADGTVVHNTTTAGKLAKYYKTRGYKVAAIQTDTWRPAAYEQLVQLGEQAGIDVYGDPNAALPHEVYNHYEEELADYDVVLVDTAGRDALNDELVEEIEDIDDAVDADEKLLVVAADVGQAAQEQAEMFHDTVGVTGVVVTKLDGTAKGGGALSACAVTGAPVKFIGVGEKLGALEEFKPENFVSRLLGMGDLESLLEKAKLAISEEEAEDIGKKLLKGEFNLLDLHEQMSAMKKMGPLNKVMEMIPGMGGMDIPKEALEAQEESLEKWRFIMQSMTKEELEEPATMNNARVSRVAQGSGQSEKEIRKMLKQYKQSKKMMKMMKGKGSEKQMKKLMKKMGGGGMPKF